MAELNTLAPMKWSASYGGVAPTIDSSSGVHVGDIAIDTSTTPNLQWKCTVNTVGSPVWTYDGPGAIITTPATSLISVNNGMPITAMYSGYAPVTSGGVAKWTLTNTLADSFGSYTLSNSGLTFSTDSAFPLGSRYVAVDGGSSYATFSDTGLPSGTSDRTMCIWVKTTGGYAGLIRSRKT